MSFNYAKPASRRHGIYAWNFPHSPVIQFCLCHRWIFVLAMLMCREHSLISHRKAPHSAWLSRCAVAQRAWCSGNLLLKLKVNHMAFEAPSACRVHPHSTWMLHCCNVFSMLKNVKSRYKKNKSKNKSKHCQAFGEKAEGKLPQRQMLLESMTGCLCFWETKARVFIAFLKKLITVVSHS